MPGLTPTNHICLWDLPSFLPCSGRRLDALVANAAVYLPTAKEPTFTADGFELSVG